MRAILPAFAVFLAACASPASVPADASADAEDAAADVALADLPVVPDVADVFEVVDVGVDACVCEDGNPCVAYLDGKCPVLVGTEVAFMPCNANADCNPNGATGSYCAPLDKGNGSTQGFIDGHVCLTPCTEATAAKGAPVDICAPGFHCQTVNMNWAAPLVTAKLCVRDSQEVICTAAWAQAAKSSECQKSNSAGTCKSVRTCVVGSDGKPIFTVCDAPVPMPEVCGDGVDNDCDGTTDGPGASGCTNYYQDNDGDGFGVGWATQANCLCADPGVGYSKFGNDCDDKSVAIHPGAKEACNGVDDNCNGMTDESGGQGCTIYFHDLDGDGFGSGDDSACICAGKVTSEWILVSGDCNDTPGVGLKFNPSATEICDGVDNNCDGKTDPAGTSGCKMYYTDADGDGYGVTASGVCLCVANTTTSADALGDCNDGQFSVNPGMNEVCDGLDNDCNGATDDGSASDTCDGGSCVAGACASPCPSGYVDLNASATDGCECAITATSAGATCGGAQSLGDLPEGATMTVGGQVMPGEAGDWYTFNSIDAPDTSPSAVSTCDAYDVHIAFLSNPGGQFVFDAFRGGCGVADKVCGAETQHDWSVNFYGGAPFGVDKLVGKVTGWYQLSPTVEQAGECNCVPAKETLKPCVSYNPWSNPTTDPSLMGCGPNGLPGMNVCKDNSAVYFVRVYRKPGAPMTCDNYAIRFNNTPEGLPQKL